MIEALEPVAETVLQNGDVTEAPFLENEGAAAIAVGLSAIAAGYAERGIGAAAIGAIAEDDDLFVPGLIMTVLPETLVIFALVVVFII
ncbi:hypothetical protein [Natrarchaeobaculum aegyptiacum]|uniref:V-ATPase proteolipid subunit C-like domain-containing protein n=1 Tax=Natrarchaeobaculum aegyptiacum TaxID=745377 RepID=A0A2Z2HV42_9EURY|nr:hypothetical protein [Natrarchaeobaculum aegyptiacum]ARS90035.1 hypothetical protein B1756_10055 [Natrarchaeobaculum aegyptiacum]